MKTKDKLRIMEQALRDIVNPIEAMKRDIEDGYELNGLLAYELSNDPNYLKDVASKALREIKLTNKVI